jgi:heat shock protein HtpX
MNIAQIGKRVLLFVLVNFLVVTTVTAILGLLMAARGGVPVGGLTSLAIFCLVVGFGGALVSLAMSRLSAKWFMGVRVIDPNTSDPTLSRLVETVHHLARAAGLPAMPEVGIYQSDEVNAFATGPTKSRALVAVSTGLLQRMEGKEMEGVLGHEITHVANGDMVTMTLIQGVINALVLFLARILAYVVTQAIRSRDDRGGGWFLRYMLVSLFQIVFSILGSIVVCWFSRWREFRADAGGARLAGRSSMISALRALQSLHDPDLAAAEAGRAPSFQALKISGRQGGLLNFLFADHPPLEERIARLEQGAD